MLVANAQVAGIYVVLDEWSDRKEKGDERVELPNSLDKDHARKIFAETRRLETRYAPFVEWERKAFHGETVNVDEAGDRVHHAPGRGIDHKLVYPRQQQAISALQAKGNGDWIHDVTDAHDGDEFIYTGPCHATENGNAIMARRIAGVVAPILARRAARRRPEEEGTDAPVSAVPGAPSGD